MAGDDTGLLVITGGVTGKLEDFSCQVLEDSSKIDGGTATYTSSIASLLEVTCDTANRELKTSLG